MLLLCSMALFVPSLPAQNDTLAETAMTAADSLLMAGAPEELPSPEDLVGEDVMALRPGMAENTGLHDQLKTKFVEGSAGFMSLVALALILGLTLCIERIIYLTLAEVNAKKLLRDVEKKVEAGDMEGAKALCRDTRGPVASICYQGLLRMDESLEDVERSIVSFGAVQSARMERGCSWISLFITMAPALGFLGTVIGMVMAFDQIQQAGDISPTIVASGMKVALITTIFGIIVALILQVFYNYIITKIERITTQMEEAAVSLLDILAAHKQKQLAKNQ
jgi:biopolymer transport protein ExbB